MIAFLKNDGNVRSWRPDADACPPAAGRLQPVPFVRRVGTLGLRRLSVVGMIVAIHQPQYLPWLGYFDKMLKADVFCYLDTVQYKKNEWQNRNRIRTAR